MKRILTKLLVSTASGAALFLFLCSKDSHTLPSTELNVDRAWTATVPAALRRHGQTGDELDVFEVIVRDVVAKRFYESPVFLSFDQKDPTDAFIARLSDLQVPLRRMSEVEPPSEGILDPR